MRSLSLRRWQRTTLDPPISLCSCGRKAADYAEVLQPAFAAAGIPLRNEAETVGAIALQELLTEDVSELIVSVLRLATTTHAGRHWIDCQLALAALRGIDHQDQIRHAQFAKELDAFAKRLASEYPRPPITTPEASRLVNDVLTFIGRERLVAARPGYSQGDWLDRVLESTAIHLAQSAAATRDWKTAMDTYEGLHALPLMTIHKSKGLEYHTVIFVGLDDDAWWSFAKDKVEGTAGFFVAFTRAKQRVAFTYCRRRGTRTKIAPLYGLLRKAGVQAFRFD